MVSWYEEAFKEGAMDRSVPCRLCFVRLVVEKFDNFNCDDDEKIVRLMLRSFSELFVDVFILWV